MQKTLLFLLAAVAALLGVVALQQSREIKTLSKQIADFKTAEMQKKTADLAAERSLAEAQAKSEAFQRESASLRSKLAEVEPSPTPEATPAATPTGGKSASGGMKSMIEKMMKDPQMKKAIAAQQMAFLKPMYASLIKSLNLTPAQADKFFELLANRSMKMMDDGMSALNGGEVKPGDYNQEMKDLLGDSGFTQFQNYEKSVPDRMALNQFSQQMSTSGTPLQGWQSDGLLQIMQQEKVDASKSLGGAGSNPSAFTDDQITAFMDATKQRNDRILNRSKSLLSPEQLKSLEASQTQTLQMMQMGLKMSRDMMTK